MGAVKGAGMVTRIGIVGLGQIARKRHVPTILADAWRYDSSVSAFVGGPGAKLLTLSLHLMRTSLMEQLLVSVLKFAQPVASCAKCRVVSFVRTPQSLALVPCSCLLGSS